MTKIQDLPHGVLFKFSILDTESKYLTVCIEDVLCIKNDRSQKIDGLYVGQKIHLSEENTLYSVESISLQNLSSFLKNFKFGTSDFEINCGDKDYLFSIDI